MLKRADHSKSILLVDDDESSSKILAMLLETRGYHVDIARSGEEAFQKVSHSTDLILLDLILPDQEGFEVCRQLKERQATHQIPIIIVSAKLLSGDIVEGLYLGADDYLTKPFECEELIARMEAVMRRRPLFPVGYHSSTTHEDSVVCEIRKIIDEGLIGAAFQPIYLLKPLKLFGFEALARPQTEMGLLANPELLFKAAMQFGFYQDLEILCWKKALEHASDYLTTQKLFLNCNPYLVEGSRFVVVKSLFEKSAIKTQNVFLEITERSAIIDFKAFYQYLTRYRQEGFNFVVDDVGGGYASLESIVETKPEAVKIDRHIINDLHNDAFKKSIVKFVVSFCRENAILSIAEGIETKKDFDTIVELGVDAAQGFYLYRPAPRIDLERMNDISGISS